MTLLVGLALAAARERARGAASWRPSWRASPSSTARPTRSRARSPTGRPSSAGQEVVLEGRRYPYEGSYRVIERTTTDAEGAFSVRARARSQPPPARHRSRAGTALRRAQRLHAAGLRALVPGAAPGCRAALPALHGAEDRAPAVADALLPRPARGPRARRCARAARSSARAPGATRRRSRSRCPSAGTARSATRAASARRPGSGMGDPGARCPKVKLEF